MKWAFFKKTKPLIPPPAEGEAAHERAMDSLALIDERWDEIRATARSLRQTREDNHFADKIQDIFAAKRKGDGR